MPATEAKRHRFPSTRYMGSKAAILHHIRSAVSDLPFNSVLDAFSGSACVSYMFKEMGKQVFANDHLVYSATTAKATIENSSVVLGPEDVEALLRPNQRATTFVQDTFRGLYFRDEENWLIDNVMANIRDMRCPLAAALARAALARACLKRRPRGVFTYTGYRYDDGRKDLRLPLSEHFRTAVRDLNLSVFDNGRENRAFQMDVFDLDVAADLVYLDPPYHTPHSDNDYLRGYHFLEGICRDWQGVEILPHTKTKKLRKYPTPFDSGKTVHEAFQQLFRKFADSILVVSYSSNGVPNKDELVSMLAEVKRTVRVIEVPHRYSFGTHAGKVNNKRNLVREYLFVLCSVAAWDVYIDMGGYGPCRNGKSLVTETGSC